MINVGDLVYIRGDEHSPPMRVKSISGDKALCEWKVKGEFLEREYEIEELTTTHAKFGNVKPE